MTSNNNSTLEHRAFWSTKQVCQRYGGVTPRSLNRYQTKFQMPKPIKQLGINLYSIPKLLEWEVQTFGETVFPQNWDEPETIKIERI